MKDSQTTGVRHKHYLPGTGAGWKQTFCGGAVGFCIGDC